MKSPASAIQAVKNSAVAPVKKVVASNTANGVNVPVESLAAKKPAKPVNVVSVPVESLAAKKV